MSYRNCEGEAPQDGNVKTQLSELENLQVLFHVTNADAAFSILQAGFLDGRGSYMTDAVLEGVWLSDEPLSQNEGAWGDHILEVAFPESIDLSEYEVIEEGKPYREWLLPAELINAVARVRRFVK